MSRAFRRIAASLVLAETLALAGCSCLGHQSPETPKANPYLQAVNADLAEAARRFADGKLTGRQYQDLASDRAAKARRYRDDAAWRDAAKSGDRDQDRVPDPLDSCVSSPFTPTDEKGCPPPAHPDCISGDVPCPPTSPDDDARLRGLLDQATILFNPACDGAPPPRASNPFAWGHGTPDTFILIVGKAGSPPPGCDLFYEMELRIEVLHHGPDPLVRYITVLFRHSEDLTPLDPKRAVFRLPLDETGKPARADLWGALQNAGSVRWRVRAINGAQASSAWSVMTPKNQTVGGLPF
jgi:hypothetical protein